MKKRVLFLFLIVVLLFSCATIGIPERKDNNSALLVIPVTLKGGAWKQSFSYYILEFGTHKIALRGSAEAEYVIVRISAGEYKSYKLYMAGYGTSSGNKINIFMETSLNNPYVINPGEVFIFPKAIIYSVVSKGSGTVTSPGTKDIDQKEYQRIRDLLLQEDNIEQWEIQDFNKS
ncbi:MAG: hypothetical protein JW874_00995 [Spirochaetales bacterium]|nr:hypothetical protein [Spirochaetales bacterium]